VCKIGLEKTGVSGGRNNLTVRRTCGVDSAASLLEYERQCGEANLLFVIYGLQSGGEFSEITRLFKGCEKQEGWSQPDHLICALASGLR